jgi:hypothetical protein
MNVDIEKQSPSEILADAEVIIGPWTMALVRETDEAVSKTAANAIASSPARKLLIPTIAAGWGWVGVESLKKGTIVDEVVNAVKQIAVGEEVKQTSKLGPVAIVGIILIALCILSSIIPLVFEFFEF